jgi:CHAT domain-containing protein
VRVLVDLEERAGELLATVTVSAAGGLASERPVRWTDGRRLLVARDDPISDADAAALASAVDQGSASPADLARYGSLLFGAAFSDLTWRDLVTTAAAGPCLELAIRAPAPDERRTSGALHALRWEALYDGGAHVAAKGAVNQAAPLGRRVPVGIVRLVPPATVADGGLEPFIPVTRIPRVLYAIGSRLTDPQVRAGAEFMGIMRHLERNGGAVHPQVLESATVSSLTTALDSFEPDILHIIGHGRWFSGEECVKLQLRAEGLAPGDEYLTATQLLEVFDGASHVPRLVVLSACQTASVHPAGDYGGNDLPFAARLVAGGVPIVVAMAGDIADTACRVFTRAVTAAIGRGIPLVEGVIRGRQATFRERPDYGSVDWIMPAVFLAECLPGDTRLVDTTVTAAARKRIQDLGCDVDPVFCGRGEFVAAMDRLLNGRDPLNVLVAYTSDPDKSYGGTRLLRELGARAVREGRLPVMLGPFNGDPPVTRVGFAEALADKITEIRDLFGLPARPSQAVEAAVRPGAKRLDLVRAIHADLDGLVGDLPDGDPVKASPQPRVVLLCHRVDQWLDALEDLIGMLGPRGLHPGPDPVPVVLTGADTRDLHDVLEGSWRGPSWVRCAPLGRFSSEDDEDILAYQWWLLNPPEEEPVFAPKRGVSSEWQAQLRWVMDNAAKALYDEKVLFGFAKTLVGSLTSDRDDDLLASYDRTAG